MICHDCDLNAYEHSCKLPGLRAALEQRGVTLTDTDKKMLRWFAQWDRSTTDWFVSVVTRAAEAGERGGDR